MPAPMVGAGSGASWAEADVADARSAHDPITDRHLLSTITVLSVEARAGAGRDPRALDEPRADRGVNHREPVTTATADAPDRSKRGTARACPAVPRETAGIRARRRSGRG